MSAQSATNKTKARKLIFLLDDHPVVLEGLVQQLSRQHDLHVCGEASDAAQALSAIAKLRPDLVIADINLPGRSGLEFIKDLRAIQPDLPILVLSMHDESLFAERALRAGAKGFVSKRAGGAKLLEAVRSVLDGHLYLSQAAQDKLLGSLGGGKSKNPPSPLMLLTDRELEVFKLIGLARQTREIARELNMSVKTVEVHRANIKQKLKVKTGPELTRQAVLWVESIGK